MKNIKTRTIVSLLFISILLLFQYGCSKTPTTVVSPQGNWKGSYKSTNSSGDYGSWDAYIDGSKNITVTLHSTRYNKDLIKNGQCGTTSVFFGNSSGGMQFNGTYSGTNMSGTFYNNDRQEDNGSWSGSKL